MTRDRITWRTFDDDGSSNRQWNRPATPTYYIIDHKGVIPHTWVGRIGNAAIDTALATLIVDAKHSAVTK